MKPEQWPASKVVLRNIADIKPYFKNPKTHSDRQVELIAESMKTDGVTAPILVDEDGVIIYGHGRRLGALKNGYKKYPTCTATGWAEEQKMRVRLSDNKLAELSEWDDDLLGGELTALSEAGVDLPMLGFSDEELAGFGLNVAEGEFPGLSSEDRSPFQQLTFTLHDSQVDVVKIAIEAAKAAGEFKGPNENSNGNALARICETYQRQGDQAGPDQPRGRKRAGKKAALQRKNRRK